MTARLRAIALALSATLSLGISPPPATAQATLTEEALRAKGGKRLVAVDFDALYVGNTLTGTTADGDAFHVFIANHTDYRMLYQGKRTGNRWNASPDGEFCASDGIETTCTREYMHEQTVYSFNRDGTLAGSARIRPGNPEGL